MYVHPLCALAQEPAIKSARLVATSPPFPAERSEGGRVAPESAAAFRTGLLGVDHHMASQRAAQARKLETLQQEASQVEPRGVTFALFGVQDAPRLRHVLAPCHHMRSQCPFTPEPFFVFHRPWDQPWPTLSRSYRPIATTWPSLRPLTMPWAVPGPRHRAPWTAAPRQRPPSTQPLRSWRPCWQQGMAPAFSAVARAATVLMTRSNQAQLGCSWRRQRIRAESSECLRRAISRHQCQRGRHKARGGLQHKQRRLAKPQC
jgi:hypothetical protein